MGDGERVGLRTLLSAERDRDLEGERLELHERGWGPGLRDELFPSGPPCRPCTPGDGETLAGRARGGLSFARLPCPPEPGSGPGPGAPPPPESLLERALLSERDGPRGGGGRARRRPLRRGAPAGDLERRLRRRLRLRRRRRACPPAARSPRPCDDGAERGLVLSFPRAGDGAAPASAWSPTLGEGELGLSGGLCAKPGRPPCAPLRCRLPPFCWGDPHPLPPDREGDRLPLDRWLPVFRPSPRGLGLSLLGDLESLSWEESEGLWELPLLWRWDLRPGDSCGLFLSLFFSFLLLLGLRDLCRLFLLDPESDLSLRCFFTLFFFLRRGEELPQLHSESSLLFLRLLRWLPFFFFFLGGGEAELLDQCLVL